jgi:hypothetical protein
VECPTPQERAIAGPAVYPINAPATAPTGPRTMAPDTAPKAALPSRSCGGRTHANKEFFPSRAAGRCKPGLHLVAARRPPGQVTSRGHLLPAHHLRKTTHLWPRARPDPRGAIVHVRTIARNLTMPM